MNTSKPARPVPFPAMAMICAFVLLALAMPGAAQESAPESVCDDLRCSFRITHTTSLSTSSLPHLASVSSAVFEYPKSIARVKSSRAWSES